MFFLLFWKYSISCDLKYTLDNHDPFYLEAILKPSQTLCINTTVENTIFIFNSLDNATFKVYDDRNHERILGFDEMYKNAAGVNFGKPTGSLVLRNSDFSTSFISLSAISFTSEECEIKIISNQIKNSIFLTYDQSKVCYFNGNGLNLRYQFEIPDGTIEIRPPRDVSKNVFTVESSNAMQAKIRTVLNRYTNSNINIKKNYQNSPESIYLNSSVSYSPNRLDVPGSFVRVSGYSTVIFFSPSKSIGNHQRAFLMDTGTFYRQTLPYRLNMRFVSNEPTILTADDSRDFESKNDTYGCDPYIFKYDSDGEKVKVDKNGRTSKSYNDERVVKVVVLGFLASIVYVAFFVYFFSFCCICPCCCCYSCCHRISCCSFRHQKNYRPFDGLRSINFLNMANNGPNNQGEENQQRNYRSPEGSSNVNSEGRVENVAEEVDGRSDAVDGYPLRNIE